MSDSSTLVSLAQILLRDEKFQQSYRYQTPKYGLNRRNEIQRAFNDRHDRDISKEDREQLRRYFDELWNLPNAEYVTDSADMTAVYVTDYFERGAFDIIPDRNGSSPFFAPQADASAYANQALISLNPITPKETIMNAASTSTPITVTTQVLINGRLASQYSDAELFQSIAHQEQAIKDLDGIENKPNSLVDEIVARKAGIQALVTYLDSRPKK